MEIPDLYGELKDNDFQKIGSFIYKNYGINLYPKKKVLLKSRLQKRLKHLGISSYSDYRDYLFNNKEEIIHMIDKISTNKTDFFREAVHFEYLEDIIKNGFANNLDNNELLVWSAGCSSGQEAYSLAMTIDNLKSEIGYKYRIFASDISLSVLKTAKEAIYPFNLLNQIPLVFRKKYLLKSKDKINPRFRIVKELRDNTEFSFYNLLSKDAFSKLKFNIIFCRNTLIYFDTETQIKVMHNLISHLKKGGLLFLGHSESIINMGLPLETVHPSVYEKK
jgi:chemotaxis protein methyltransferase CheR